ncbi:MAG TPA: HIT domain-containing protein [Gaiella sp.]|nr:HIT domain-containing protein [Gaiella sp.]
MTRPIWAPWRLEYIGEAGTQDGCVFCLEAAGELGDSESLAVHRGTGAFVLLNKYPYSSGHLMVAPLRHVGELGELEPVEAAEIHALTTRSIDALRSVYGPDAFNVGWNLGQVAGGSIAGHLHEHVVPRWSGDTNFMPVLADIKVVPEHLLATRDRLREAWSS